MYRLFLLDQTPLIQINIGHNVDRKAKVFPWKPERQKEEKNGHESLKKFFVFDTLHQ